MVMRTLVSIKDMSLIRTWKRRKW